MTQRPVSSTVSQDIALHCLDELGRPMTFMASFGYHPDDPYAVWLTFHIPAGDVQWAVARSLVRRGLTEPAGEGDIRFWPSIDEDMRAVVCMDFHSPEGRLITHARTNDLHDFLGRTWEAVPPGSESDRVDLDLLVDSLLTIP
jgi:hypothetical protein